MKLIKNIFEEIAFTMVAIIAISAIFYHINNITEIKNFLWGLIW